MLSECVKRLSRKSYVVSSIVIPHLHDVLFKDLLIENSLAPSLLNTFVPVFRKMCRNTRASSFRLRLVTVSFSGLNQLNLLQVRLVCCGLLPPHPTLLSVRVASLCLLYPLVASSGTPSGKFTFNSHSYSPLPPLASSPSD